MGTQVNSALKKRKTLLLACLLTAVFMAILDVAVANIALPAIRTTLHASGVQLQFVTAAYIAAYAVLLIVCARLGRLLGYRRTFLTGLLLFTSMSLFCGAAWTTNILIACRFLQGVGAALVMPQVLSLIQHQFEGAERVSALSWYGTIIAGAAIIGQILGGVLVSADLFGLSWRTVFLVNVPIGIILFAASLRFLPQDEARVPLTVQTLDPAGVGSLAATLVGLVLPATFAGELGWQEWMGYSLSLSIAAAIWFIRHERRLAMLGGQPLIHRDLIRPLQFSINALALLVAMAGYGGMLFLLTIYIQTGLGRSALITGLAFLPSALAFGTVSLYWRHLPGRWHRWLPGIGLALACAAFVTLGLSTATRGITIGMETAIFAFGLGMGLGFSPLFATAITAVQAQYAADASGVLTTANQLGQVLGVAGYGALLLATAAHGNIMHAALVTAFAMAAGSMVAAILTISTASLSFRKRRPNSSLVKN